MIVSILERHLADEADTALLGEDIAIALRTGDVIALEGALGAGKTAVARATIRALADDPGLEVPSPTFTLVQSYETRIPVQHFDLYRISAPEELDELGLDEARAQGAVFVEWPERACHKLGDVVRLQIAEDGTGRRVKIDGPKEAIAGLKRSFAVRAFLESAGKGRAHRYLLMGDASVRAYEAISTADGEKFILMDAPECTDGPPVRNGLPYSRIAHLAESVTPFVAIDIILREKGFAAPKIYARDLDQGLLLLEDLGREPFVGRDGAPVPERYFAAAELLAALHAEDWPTEIEVAPGRIHRIPSYDTGAMAIETELLLDWYLPHVTGAPPSEAVRTDFARLWRTLFERVARAERTLVLRDYHSPNLVWRPERSGRDRIGLIDFQDAVIGPAAYDVASLAQDARVTIPAELEEAIVETYCRASAERTGFDRAVFDEAYAIMAAQRASKILGIFVRLDRRDGKPAYLAHLPRLRGYLSRALRHPALADLAAFYEEAGFIAHETG